MRSIVVFDEYEETDFKPSELLNKYMQLTQEDVLSFLVKGKDLQKCLCPACRNKSIVASFNKFGLTYVECSRCGTLYISPRPPQEALNNYHVHSAARQFWRDELSKITGKKRKEKIIKPRFDWIIESTREYLPTAKHLIDINTLHYGYIEAMLSAKLFDKKTLVDPFLDFKSSGLNGQIEIIESDLKTLNLEEKADVISLFEVIDRASCIDSLFSKLYSLLNPGGLVFITTILASGFDLQILGQRAENLHPPDRMNVFTVEGLKILFKRNGFECMEFSTPGILDVEIVQKMVQKDPDIKIPKFLSYMLKNRNDNVKAAFQEFLQANLLSSYGRILIRRKGE